MSDGACDTKIYERLTMLEIGQGRAEERMARVDEDLKEYRQDIKDLKKSSIASEVRLGLVIGALIFVAQWLFK